jgi:Rrf2 family protein
LKLSKETRSGLLGVLALADHPANAVVPVAEIAAATGLSQPFLAKAFQRLARGGVLRAHRGRSRGYALAMPPDEISLKAVVEAIEGPQIFRHCVFWSDVCSEAHPCVLHETWRETAERERTLMASTTVAELKRQAESGSSGQAESGQAVDGAIRSPSG